MPILLLVLNFAISISASASDIQCHSHSKTHALTLNNTLQGVEIGFQELSAQPVDPPSVAPSLKISGSTKTTRVLHNMNISDLKLRLDIAREVLVSIMRSRDEFDGDADLHHYYASNYLRNLKCN